MRAVPSFELDASRRPSQLQPTAVACAPARQRAVFPRQLSAAAQTIALCADVACVPCCGGR